MSIYNKSSPIFMISFFARLRAFLISILKTLLKDNYEALTNFMLSFAFDLEIHPVIKLSAFILVPCQVSIVNTNVVDLCPCISKLFEICQLTYWIIIIEM